MILLYILIYIPNFCFQNSVFVQTVVSLCTQWVKGEYKRIHEVWNKNQSHTIHVPIAQQGFGSCAAIVAQIMKLNCKCKHREYTQIYTCKKWWKYKEKERIKLNN